MNIKILKPVQLDFEGKLKVYHPSEEVFEISDELATEKKYQARYEKYADFIEIVEEEVIEEPTEDEEEVIELEVESKEKAESSKKNGSKKE